MSLCTRCYELQILVFLIFFYYTLLHINISSLISDDGVIIFNLVFSRRFEIPLVYRVQVAFDIEYGVSNCVTKNIQNNIIDKKFVLIDIDKITIIVNQGKQFMVKITYTWTKKNPCSKYFELILSKGNPSCNVIDDIVNETSQEIVRRPTFHRSHSTLVLQLFHLSPPFTLKLH